MKLALLAPIVAAAGLTMTATTFPAAAQGDAAAAPALAAVLAHERRDGDRARDQYRRPTETLAFFQVEPDMTVVEYGPGGGWYTRVLAPYIMPAGEYVAINADSSAREYRDRAQEARAKGWTERFKSGVADLMDVEAEDVNAFEIDELPEEMVGAADRILIFRSLHGFWNGNVFDSNLKTMRALLKDDGMIGVVQHRANTDAPFEYRSPARGYMRQADVIKLFEVHGFELVGSSEINANPKDPSNWERGVWTLPPVLATGEDDPRRSEYLAIGESDRMTLLFKKAN